MLPLGDISGFEGLYWASEAIGLYPFEGKCSARSGLAYEESTRAREKV